MKDDPVISIRVLDESASNRLGALIDRRMADLRRGDVLRLSDGDFVVCRVRNEMPTVVCTNGARTAFTTINAVLIGQVEHFRNGKKIEHGLQMPKFEMAPIRSDRFPTGGSVTRKFKPAYVKDRSL